MTLAKKGETVTVIACWNAEGFFIPPACIFKGKNKEEKFEEGMPSVVFMNENSVYISPELMFK